MSLQTWTPPKIRKLLRTEIPLQQKNTRVQPFFCIRHLTQTIHGTGIFTYIYHKNPPNVGEYTIVPWIRQWVMKGVDPLSLSMFSMVDFPISSQKYFFLTCRFFGRRASDSTMFFFATSMDTSRWIKALKTKFKSINVSGTSFTPCNKLYCNPVFGHLFLSITPTRRRAPRKALSTIV